MRCGRAIEKCAREHGLLNVPPLSRRSWFRDFTEEGIHSHTRPSGPSFHCVSLNVNGAERAWKAAQHYMQQKVDFLCLQEVKLTPEKANSFMCMAHKHKYYSMFVLSWGREKNECTGPKFLAKWNRGVCAFSPSDPVGGNMVALRSPVCTCRCV